MIHSFGEVSGERTCFPLFIPLTHPIAGADSREALLEVLAWLVVLAADVNATVEVQIVLEAVPGITEMVTLGKIRVRCWRLALGATQVVL